MVGGWLAGSMEDSGLLSIATISDSAAAANAHLAHCTLCEHRCGANRYTGEKGPCKAGAEARLFRHRIETGEELELIPSHLFYLSGCDLRCAFCIAEANAFNPQAGELLTPELFHAAVEWGQWQGARTLQWVGGEPTIHIPAILRVMAACPVLPPVVWKSDFYGTPAAFALLDGIVDTYVADFKFGNDACARRIASVDHYLRTVTRNLDIAAAQGNLIVRHLILPGHFECCFRPIVNCLAEEFPAVKFSLRDGYLPKWQARRHHELAAPLRVEEAQRAREFATLAGLNLIY
jgi:putative pyruvate formate lyase activating enzyme